MIIYFFLKGKKNPLMYSYIWCQSLIFIWSIGQLFELMAVDLQSKWLAVIFEYLAICFLGLSWLLFSLLYAEYQIYANKSKILLLFIPPVIFYISVLTNEYHKLFFSTFEYRHRVYGVLFWMHSIVVYAYILIGTYILIKCSINKFGYAKKQSILLVISVSIPVILNILYVFKTVNFGFDITPFSFAFSLLLFAIVTFRYRFLNIMPVALCKIFDNVNESIIVVDVFSKVISFNNVFKKTFSWLTKIENDCDINIFADSIKQSSQKDEETDRIIDTLVQGSTVHVTGELNITTPSKKCFCVNIRPIYNSHNEILGRVASFNDISEYKNILNEVNEKNIELSALNEQLTEHINTVEELAIVNERYRLSHEVHDTLGHTMTLLITLMKVSRIACRKSPDEAEEKLSVGIDLAVNGLEEIRRFVSGLSPGKLERNIVNALEQLIQNSRNTGLKVEFSVYGQESKNSTVHSEKIYIICQEAITNSLRHGNANYLDIILKFTDDKIKLFIIDDGIGCKKLKKGFGLSGIEEKVKNINGTISYGSSGENGFSIHVEIPIKIGS